MAELLTPKNVAARMGVSRGRLYQLITAGVVPHIRVGRRIYIPQDAWEKWLDQQSRNALNNVRVEVV